MIIVRQGAQPAPAPEAAHPAGIRSRFIEQDAADEVAAEHEEQFHAEVAQHQPGAQRFDARVGHEEETAVSQQHQADGQGAQGVQAEDALAGHFPFAGALRWRSTSKSATPVATDTLRLSTLPRIGMRATKSQASRVRRRMPSPSLPITRATGPLRSTR